MKRKIMLCIVVLLCGIINAQNTIKGKITGEDNQPLIGATVFVAESNSSALSDDNGNYSLTGLRNGKNRVQYSFLGYASNIETVVLTGTTVTVNVTLHQTTIETEAIVVTGGFNATQHQNAVKIDVLKLNAHNNIPSANFTELLTKMPGVDMISKGSGVSKPVIRGLSMNDILVLNNGVRFENYQYSSHHPLGIDEFGIESVEVVKGPASLLYGSDAIGGVINFIKEKPAAPQTLLGDYNLQLFSNTLGMNNNLGIKGASKKVFGGIRLGQKTHADFIQGGGDYAPNSRFNEYSVKANAGINANVGTFKLYYDHNQQKLGLVEEEAIDLIDTRGRSNDLFYQQLNTHLLSSQNKVYLGNMKLDVDMAYQNTELIHVGEPSVYEIQMDLGTLTYQTKLYLPSDANSEYVIGFQGMTQQNTNTNNRETMLLPNALVNNYSGFCLLQRTFFKQLKMQTGIRYDNKSLSSTAIGTPSNPFAYRKALDKNYGSFSGSLGATYNATDELLFRANLATAYRTPNLAELTSNGQHEARYEMGDNNLVPEKSVESDVSMHYHRVNFTVDVAGFYNTVNHYIFISPTGEVTQNGIGIYKYMQNNSLLVGGEAGVHIHPQAIDWLHFETTFATVKGKQQNGDFLPFVPADKLKFELSAEKDKLLFMQSVFASVNFNIAFNQNNAAPNETVTSGYSLLDMGIGGHVNLQKQSFFICITAYNLLDKKYIDHLSTLKEVNLFNPGRNIGLTIRVPLAIVTNR
jgi:iron complex outermembrane receptor protein